MPPEGVGMIRGVALLGLAALGVVYMLPAIVAERRDVANAGTVFAVNVLLGWTVVGWVFALRMACRKDEVANRR
jgi:hypothetical protein